MKQKEIRFYKCPGYFIPNITTREGETESQNSCLKIPALITGFSERNLASFEFSIIYAGEVKALGEHHYSGVYTTEGGIKSGWGKKQVEFKKNNNKKRGSKRGRSITCRTFPEIPYSFYVPFIAYFSSSIPFLQSPNGIGGYSPHQLNVHITAPLLTEARVVYGKTRNGDFRLFREKARNIFDLQKSFFNTMSPGQRMDISSVEKKNGGKITKDGREE